MWVAVAAALACASAPPPAPHRMQLILEDSQGGVRPLVRATVAGEPVMLLVDTGAIRSILPAEFVRAHQLRRWPASTDEEMKDVNGRVVWMSILPGVPLQFEDESRPLPLDFILNPVANGEPILVPQTLLGRGWVMVIDLERGELRYEPQAEALRRLGEEGTALQELRYSGCGDGAHRVVRATVDGVASDMLVDTGASRTTLARNHPALRSMQSRLGDRGTVTAVTSRGDALLVDQVPIGFAGTNHVLPVLVHPVSGDCWKGLLGADVLRHCTLVWGWSSLWAACRAE